MNKIEKNLNKFKSISEDEELANHWKNTHDYRYDFEKSENGPTYYCESCDKNFDEELNEVVEVK